MQPIEKIRNILFKEISLFQKKGSDPERAKIISEMSAQAVYSIRVELENKRLELEIGKADEEVKKWMDKDFSNIATMRG